MIVHNHINKDVEYLIIPKDDFSKHSAIIERYISGGDKSVLQISPTTYRKDITISDEHKEYIKKIKIDYEKEILFFIINDKRKRKIPKKQKDEVETFQFQKPKMDKKYNPADQPMKHYTWFGIMKLKIIRLYKRYKYGKNM